MVEVNNSELLQFFLREKSKEDHSFISDFLSRSQRALESLLLSIPLLPSSFSSTFSGHTPLTDLGISCKDYRIACSCSGNLGEGEHKYKVLIFTSQLDVGLRLHLDPFFIDFFSPAIIYAKCIATP